MYAEHLSNWLSYYPPKQLLVLPSEAFFAPTGIEAQMRRLAVFLGLGYAATNKEVPFE